MQLKMVLQKWGRGGAKATQIFLMFNMIKFIIKKFVCAKPIINNNNQSMVCWTLEVSLRVGIDCSYHLWTPMI